MGETNEKLKVKNIFSKISLEVLFYIAIIFKITTFCTMLKSNSGAELNLGTAIGLISYEGIYLLIPLALISIAFLFKYKGKFIYLYLLDLSLSLLLLFDLMYYRVYSNFLSVKFLIHPELYNPLDRDILFFRWRMVLIILDLILIPIIYIIFRRGFKRAYINSLKKRVIVFIIIFVLSVGYVFYKNYDEYKNTGSYAFGTEWTPSGTIFRNTPLGYHFFDTYKILFRDRDITLTSSESSEIKTWLDNNYENLPDNKYKGELKGKNLVIIQVESLEDFIIGRSVEGQEIAPTLDSMLKHAYYFPNIYEENLIGNSSDADFMVNTGMLPISSSPTSFSYPVRDLITLPKILNNMGYTTASSHPEVCGNWNWGEVHRGLFGFKNIYDMYDFDYSDVVGFGMSDKSYLTQLAEKSDSLKEPFYLFMVTLTNHGPFEIDNAHTSIKIPKEIDGTLIGQYFKTVRYTDEAINMFINKLKAEGRYKDTVFVIYGDHAGPNKYYKNQLKDVNYDGNYWKLNERKVPLIIFNPSINGKTFQTKGGLIDVMPTLGYLLGANNSDFKNTIGRNLLNTNRDIVPLPGNRVAGEAKSKEELGHVKKAYYISDEIIRSDYFKNYGK